MKCCSRKTCCGHTNTERAGLWKQRPDHVRFDSECWESHVALPPALPHKPTFVPSFYHNSKKNDHLFWGWLTGSQRHQIGLFLFGVLIGTEDVFGVKEAKKRRKVGTSKNPACPSQYHQLWNLGVVQSSCTESSINHWIWDQRRCSDRPKNLISLLEVWGSSWRDTEHPELAELGSRLGWLPFPYPCLAQNPPLTYRSFAWHWAICPFPQVWWSRQGQGAADSGSEQQSSHSQRLPWREDVVPKPSLIGERHFPYCCHLIQAIPHWLGMLSVRTTGLWPHCVWWCFLFHWILFQWCLILRMMLKYRYGRNNFSLHARSRVSNR